MALKDELLQKALRRTKYIPKTTNISSKYSHFKIYELPPIKNKLHELDTSLESKYDPDTIVETEHKSGHKTEHKLDTIVETEHKSGHKTEHKLNTIVETEHKTEHQTEHKFSFSSCIGLQRNILIFFYQECKIIRSHQTPKLSLLHIANSLKIRLGSVKTSIRRLEEKGAIKRTEFKNGRAGWSKYELEEFVYREIVFSESEYKLDTKPNTKLDTIPASSSSYLYNKTTTTSENEIELTDKWQEIDITPLDEFGFIETHLNQIASQAILSPEVVQDSINAFAFDMKRNNKGKSLKGLPINYFMGILRKGRVYAPPGNYESPQDEAMRLYLAKQTELAERRRKMEEEIFSMHFDTWRNELTEEKMEELLPKNNGFRLAWGAKEAHLRQHYRETIWDFKKQEILQKIGILGNEAKTQEIKNA